MDNFPPLWKNVFHIVHWKKSVLYYVQLFPYLRGLKYPQNIDQLQLFVSAASRTNIQVRWHCKPRVIHLNYHLLPEVSVMTVTLATGIRIYIICSAFTFVCKTNSVFVLCFGLLLINTEICYFIINTDITFTCLLIVYLIHDTCKSVSCIESGKVFNYFNLIFITTLISHNLRSYSVRQRFSTVRRCVKTVNLS